MIIASGFFLFKLVGDFNPDQDVDMIAVNKIVKSAQENWNHLDLMDTTLHPYDFSIINNDGTILLKSSESVPADVYESVRTKQSVMDITINKITVGKAIIITNITDNFTGLINKLSFFILLTYLLLAAFLLICFLYLYFSLIRPFQKLTYFAKNISNGNFDAPLPMDKKNIFGAFTESFDVMREALAEARRNEQLANQSKTELVASLSHDIKTPTTSIKIITELLLVTAKDEALRSKLNTIYMKAEQIETLINNLFHASLEELGELSINTADEQSLVLYDLIKNAEYGEQQITVDTVPPCIVRVDLLRLGQVFTNIIKNSHKYASTPIHIHFAFIPGFLQINIDDFGPGVKEDEIAYILQKFYRGTNATLKKKEGEGLGLFIAKSLMNKMNGDIECVNRQDGFTVKLFIPLSS